MSIAPLSSSATSSVSTSTSSRTESSERTGRAQPAAASNDGPSLGGIAEGVVAGVSATVAFSGEALHALAQAGQFVVDGAEDLAVGAWHGLELGAQAVEHVADAVATGTREIAETAAAAGKQLAHYAAVGAHATGEAVSDVASGTVMAASAAGKTLMTLV